MKILVAGGFDAEGPEAEACRAFCASLGREVAVRGHTVLGGCQTLVDSTVAEAAAAAIREQGGADDAVQERVISYVNKGTKPTHGHGRVLASKLASWDFSADDVYVPEPVRQADAVVLVHGWTGTLRAANWARYARKPLLPVATLAGASERIFEKERHDFDGKYGHNVTDVEYDCLSQHTTDWDTLSRDVVALAEKITTSRSVFVVMSFSAALLDLLDAVQEVCAEFGLEAQRVDETNLDERIFPKIEEGIRKASFIIADLTEERPNVYYELGLADGLQKRKILTAREGSKIHFDVFDVPVLFWANLRQLKEGLRERFAQMTGVRKPS